MYGTEVNITFQIDTIDARTWKLILSYTQYDSHVTSADSDRAINAKAKRKRLNYSIKISNTLAKVENFKHQQRCENQRECRLEYL